MLRVDRAARRPSRLFLVAACVLVGTSCEDVSVTAVDVASLTLAPDQGTIAEGDTVRLRATLQDASGNSLSDRPVEWTAEDPEVARLEADGLVRGLSAGTTIVRASSGGATGEALITVLEGPLIVLSNSELAFQGRAGGPRTGARAVEISNGGGGSLDGLRLSIIHPSGHPDGWMEADLQETSAPTVILLRANPGLLAAGEYRPRVHVISDHASNSPQVIDIAFHVEEEPPAVEVEPRALGFAVSEGEGAPSSQTVSVTNGGAGDLGDLGVAISYEDGEPTGWLDAELAGTTAPTELTLRVDPEGLEPPLVLDATVEVHSPSAPESAGVVRVRFRFGVIRPEIELDRTEIVWDIVEGSSAPAAEVSIDNRGGGTLEGLSASFEYQGGGSSGWLGAQLTSTEAPSVLRAHLSGSGLPPGEHRATIRIAAAEAVNSPRSVGVRVLVTERPPPAPGVCSDIDRIRVDLKAIEDAAPGSARADKIEDVRQGTEQAYFERCVKTPPDRQAAAGNIEGAVGDMEAAVKDGLIGTAQGISFMHRLASVNRAMAVEAIEAAQDRGGRPGHIFRAQRHVSEGDLLRTLGAFKDAAARYGDAISVAEGA